MESSIFEHEKSKHEGVIEHLNNISTIRWQILELPLWATLISNYFLSTPGPHLMRIHLVRYSTSARYEKYSHIHLVRPIIHLVRPIIHLVRIFALSTSWIN